MSIKNYQKYSNFNGNCNYLHSTDASFGKDGWKEKKNEVVTYFTGQFAGRAHMKYTSQYIFCKVLSIVTIVSTNHAS